MEPINKRLQRFRKEKGYTLKQVATLIGISTSTYRDWEYGKSIRGEPYAALANVYGVSLTLLLTGQEDGELREELMGRAEAIRQELENIVRIIRSL